MQGKGAVRSNGEIGDCVDDFEKRVGPGGKKQPYRNLQCLRLRYRIADMENKDLLHLDSRSMRAYPNQKLRDHVTQVAKGKKDLDSYLTQSRNGCRNEMEQLFAELNPLLKKIGELDAEVRDQESQVHQKSRTVPTFRKP